MSTYEINETAKLIDYAENEAIALTATLDAMMEDKTTPEELKKKLYNHVEKLDKHRKSIKNLHGTKHQNLQNPSLRSKSQIELIFERIEEGELLRSYDTAEKFKRLKKSDRLIHRLMWSFSNAAQSSYEYIFHRFGGTKRKAIES